MSLRLHQSIDPSHSFPAGRFDMSAVAKSDLVPHKNKTIAFCQKLGLSMARADSVSAAFNALQIVVARREAREGVREARRSFSDLPLRASIRKFDEIYRSLPGETQSRVADIFQRELVNLTECNFGRGLPRFLMPTQEG